jgi:hypothetical protein
MLAVSVRDQDDAEHGESDRKGRTGPDPPYGACPYDVAGEALRSPPANTRGARAAVDRSAMRAVKGSSPAQGETLLGLARVNPR